MRRRPMNRRQALTGIATLAIQAFLPPAGAAAKSRPFTKRVRPTDPAWPSAASWAQLNRETGGNLIEVPSLFGMCERQAGDAACTDAIKNAHNPFYIGDQPGGTQVSGWVDAWVPAPSAYAVAARKPSDIVAAVNFARENRLRLVLKGGGHSYQGTSNAPDSLLIWTRAMNAMTLHDAFVPKGCEKRQEPQAAVTVEAGAMWIDAYNAVTTQAGRYVQDGGCTTVGVAGLVWTTPP